MAPLAWLRSCAHRELATARGWWRRPAAGLGPAPTTRQPDPLQSSWCLSGSRRSWREIDSNRVLSCRQCNRPVTSGSVYTKLCPQSQTVWDVGGVANKNCLGGGGGHQARARFKRFSHGVICLFVQKQPQAGPPEPCYGRSQHRTLTPTQHEHAHAHKRTHTTISSHQTHGAEWIYKWYVHPSADCVVGLTTISASRPGPLGRR